MPKKKKVSAQPLANTKESSMAGRKRDPSLDQQILEATTQVLAELGFDAMTMDQVAARAGSAKTSVYRRWKSKPELVRDALIWMSQSSVDLNHVPDTGNLRDDLLSVQKEYSKDFSDYKTRVLSGLGSFATAHASFRAEVMDGVFGPLNDLNLKLMERARNRGEIPTSANIEMASETIIATIAYRTTVLLKAFDKTMYAKLLDTIVLPALKFN